MPVFTWAVRVVDMFAGLCSTASTEWQIYAASSSTRSRRRWLRACLRSSTLRGRATGTPLVRACKRGHAPIENSGQHERGDMGEARR